MSLVEMLITARLLYVLSVEHVLIRRQETLSRSVVETAFCGVIFR
jgi:hypothetical protein